MTDSVNAMTDSVAAVTLDLDDASTQGCIGQCNNCYRLAQGRAVSEEDLCCKNCDGEIVPLVHCKTRGRLEIDNLLFGVCTGCDGYGPIYNQCPSCEDQGYMYDQLTKEDEAEIIARSCDPLCKCEPCIEECKRLLPRFPPQLILAQSMVQAVRAFEGMLETGMDESFWVSTAIWHSRHEIKFQEDKLFEMYFHHSRICNCIVCKFCTVLEVDKALRSKLELVSGSDKVRIRDEINDEIDEEDEDEQADEDAQVAKSLIT